MDRRVLFVRTLDQLLEGADRADEYVATRAAGLLRQLLLDGQPLVHTVNRQHRLKLRFTVTDHPLFQQAIEAHQPVIRLVLDGVFPETAPPGYRSRTLSLDDWLAHPAGSYRGTEFSFGNVIRYLANVAGGVHAGNPTSQADSGLAAIAEVLRVQGMSGVARTIRGIVRVTLAGLQPLREAVKADLQPGR
jgi:hypothetical protein